MHNDHVLDASNDATGWKSAARSLLQDRVAFRVTNPSEHALNDLIELSVRFRYILIKQVRDRDEFLLLPK